MSIPATNEVSAEPEIVKPSIWARIRLFFAAIAVRFQQFKLKRLINRGLKHARRFEPQPIQARDWMIDFELEGKRGEIKKVRSYSQCIFRGEKLLATDTSEVPGRGTRIRYIFVGNKSQREVDGDGTLTLFYSQNSLGNATKYDTCQVGQRILYEIEFLEDCTWIAALFGKAVVG